MKILAIETSCDETAVCIVEATGDFPDATYQILGNALFSQVDIHREFGGVFPMVAKREHAKALVPILKRAIDDAHIPLHETILTPDKKSEITKILEREGDLAEDLIRFIEIAGKPGIDCITITNGPGLEPALWVGVNFARALGAILDIPVIPTNHMEGHILTPLFDGTKIAPISFPTIALLISGGHTELVLMPQWGSYERIGTTRDDAVGEAFDKVARLLGLPYPGGPEISKLAAIAREKNLPQTYTLPRPMIGTNDLDFSFSGLKTAVMYTVKDKDLTDEEKCSLAREFEDAVTDVLVRKTFAALDVHNATTLIIGGGVSANTHIRNTFTALCAEKQITLYIPDHKLATDNAIMIALAGHSHTKDKLGGEITAVGNLRLR